MATADETLQDLRAAAERYHNARAHEAATRRALGQAIVTARRAGCSQQQAVELSGLSRETVRTIERSGGIQSPEWAAERYGVRANQSR